MTALGKNRLYPIDKPLPIPPASPGRPSPGPTVAPSDFNGRYTLIANGQTSGALEIAVDAGGAVTGRFRSDRNGAVYPVSGTIAADLPRRIEFEIRFPRSRQLFDGLLWTEEKNVFAGTVQIQEHPYSFVAVREGAALLPGAIEATSPPRAVRSESNNARGRDRCGVRPLPTRWYRQVGRRADGGAVGGRQGRSRGHGPVARATSDRSTGSSARSGWSARPASRPFACPPPPPIDGNSMTASFPGHTILLNQDARRTSMTNLRQRNRLHQV